MIDQKAFETAFRTRLTDDATLMTLAEGVSAGHVSPAATWALPWLRFNVQSDTPDPARGYGRRSQNIIMTLMAFDKGPAVGVGSYDRCHDALLRAEAVLLASRLTVAGMTVWDWREAGGIPGAMPADDAGFLRPQVGRMYRARVDEVTA